MSKKIVISGNPFVNGMNGIPRYEFEILKRVDAMLNDGDDVELALPADVRLDYLFKHIKTVTLSPYCKLWDLRVLDKYAKSRNASTVLFNNNGSLRCASAVCVHDLIPIEISKQSRALKKRFRKARLVMKLNLRLVKRRAKYIATVSHYSQQLIERSIKRRVTVIGSGYEHIFDIAEDDGIFAKFSALAPGGYYFSIGNLAPHKNLNWVLKNAALHPENTYAIAGKAVTSLADDTSRDVPRNVIFVGYVSDGEMKSLMKNAKALLFPTFMEGFGLPPLEALALGTQVIASSIPCLKEIYADSVHYVDPENPDVDLNGLLACPVEPPESTLSRHTWQKSAEKWYEIIKNLQNDSKDAKKAQP